MNWPMPRISTPPQASHRVAIFTPWVITWLLLVDPAPNGAATASIRRSLIFADRTPHDQPCFALHIDEYPDT